MLSDIPKLSTRSDKLLVACALAYLALPNLLFAAGWLRPLPALVCIGAIIFLSVRLTFLSYIPSIPQENRCCAFAWEILGAALLLAWVLSTGMTGFVAQSSDYIVRNAVYATLVRCDWPLQLADGSDFIYYLVSWLPPALAARLHPEGSFPLYCLAGWCALGLGLMYLLMERKLGKRALLFLVFLILTGNAASWINNGYRALYGEQLILYSPFSLFYSNGSVTQLAMTFHHAIPVWLMLALHNSGALSWKNAVCASSFVLLASPLGSIGLAAYFLFLLVFSPRKTGRGRMVKIRALLKEPGLYAGAVLGIVALLYFSSNGEGSSLRWVWNRLPLGSASMIGNCLFWAFCGTGLTVLLILWVAWATGNVKNRLVWLVAGMLLLLPAATIGVDNNELLFKASSIPYWIMSFLLTQWFTAATAKKRHAIVIFVLLTCGEAVNTLNLCYQTSRMPSEQKIRSDWQGHLYHPGHQYHSRFLGRIRPSILFYSEAGSSAHTLLSWCRRGNRSDREPLPPPTVWSASEIRATRQSSAEEHNSR